VCGICGIVSTDSDAAPRDRIAAMAAVLRHRGPDDGGVWTSRDEHTAVGLGHRRLSIIDLSPAGHQPMTNENGTLWLTYNGEIYNHAEIRRELQAAGHVYRSQTDSESILHAYEEWGDRFVDRFRGMFAFALWDRPRRRLLLVRDRLGVKPLYYAASRDAIVFGSEIKAILESGVVPARPSLGGIPEYLMFGYLAGEDTLFESVRKLPPGHLLVWEPGRVSIHQYWNVSLAPDLKTSEDEQVARFRSLFEESVRLRLMSDVPLGVFLSGGLDSSAIAAVMSRHVPGRLKTFSVGVDEAYYSELESARTVARHIDAEHHEVVLTSEAFRASLPRMIWHEDEPLWGAPSVALYAVADLASRSVKVVLTGEGSDELFAGYDRYWMNAWNSRALSVYRVVPEPVRRGIRRTAIDGPLPARWRRALGHTFLNHDTVPDGLVLDNWFSVFTPDMQREFLQERLIKELDRHDVRAAHRELWRHADGAALVDRMLYMDMKSNLVELLMKQDQMSMASSIESRVPFLDHKLVEFAATVPVSMKIGARSGKRLVKKALAAYLPHRILYQPKKGFPVPFDSWLRNEYLPQIRELLLDKRSVERGWLRTDKVRGLLDAHAQGRIDASRQIWNLWGLELWARIFFDRERSWMPQHGSRDPSVAAKAHRESGASMLVAGE
jgi:asparagine synthase (glutamine-hydrolysing)